MSLAKRHHRSLAVLMCDLDRFKDLNDTHGHRAGDAVLRAAAATLKATVRDSDHVGRFGGEEFIVLLTETHRQGALETAQRCRKAIEDLPMNELIPSRNRTQTASLGVAVFPSHATGLDELVSRADHALYQAKAWGRNQVVEYDPATFGRISKIPKKRTRPTVLILEPNPARKNRYVDLLEDGYELVPYTTSDEALAACRIDHFDVLIAACGDGMTNQAIEFFQKTLATRPDALRILCIPEKDFSVAQRGVNDAFVDSFLSIDELESKLARLIDGGLMQQQVLREQVIHGGAFDRGVFGHQASRVHELIDAAEFSVAFQPIVTCANRRVVGMEALCRTRTSITLTELFDTAVQEGRIWELGRLIRDKAAPTLTQMPDEQLMFVNLHAAELSDPALLELNDTLKEYAGRVVFEITERASVIDNPHMHAAVSKLRDIGFRLAIDDLGAGYASLNSIALLAPDFIKIDMAITRNIHESSIKSRLLRRIVQFADDEGIQVIAEGIESDAEAEVVRDIGCHWMQGFLTGYPGTYAAAHDAPATEKR